MSRRSLAAVVSVIGVVLLWLSTDGLPTAGGGRIQERLPLALERQVVALASAEYRSVEVLAPAAGTVGVEHDAKGAIVAVQLPPGAVRLCLRKAEPPAPAPADAPRAALQPASTLLRSVECAGGDVRSWDVIPIARPALAALGVLLLVAFLPPALGARWGELLADANGKPSLAAVQLLLWFVPGAMMLASLSLPVRAFPAIGSTLALLLGLSGGTALLASAAPKKPPSPSTGGGAPPTGARAIVTNAAGQGEVSRYQLLVVSVVGALTLLASFWYRLQVPAVPPEILAVIGASQATYVGAKAVDSLKP